MAEVAPWIIADDAKRIRAQFVREGERDPYEASPMPSWVPVGREANELARHVHDRLRLCYYDPWVLREIVTLLDMIEEYQGYERDVWDAFIGGDSTTPDLMEWFYRFPLALDFTNEVFPDIETYMGMPVETVQDVLRVGQEMARVEIIRAVLDYLRRDE